MGITMKSFLILLSLMISPLGYSASYTCDNSDCNKEIAELVAGKVFEDSVDGEIDVNFSLLNDNAYGAYELATGDKLGNDFGNTHGVLLEIARTDSFKINYKFVYFSNLYTERQSEKYNTDPYGSTYDQYFTEENIIKVVVNNKAQGKDQYIEVGVGIIELNYQDVRSFLSAAQQQVLMHDAMGSYHPNNLESGRENEVGGFVEAGVGKQFIYQTDNRKIRIVGDAKFSGVLSTIIDTSSVTASAGVDAYYQSSERSWAFKAGTRISSTIHRTGDTPMNELEASVGIGKGSYSFEVMLKKAFAGDKQNYQIYNYDNDTIVTLNFHKVFGGDDDKVEGESYKPEYISPY